MYTVSIMCIGISVMRFYDNYNFSPESQINFLRSRARTSGYKTFLIKNSFKMTLSVVIHITEKLRFLTERFYEPEI